MAYSTLLSLENIIGQVLIDNRFSISPRERKQIISIDKCVISLQAFLDDFPEKAGILEGRIRDVAAEAEGIIEGLWEEQIDCSCIYTSWIAALRGIMFHDQLDKVIDEMDSIAADVVEIKNSIEVKELQSSGSIGASSSSKVADTMVGFDENLIEIKDKLCGGAQLQYLSIIGMGGIGKTTLARNAYDDQLIVEHFQIRVWVKVSQNCSEQRILLDLLDSMKEFDPETVGRNFTSQVQFCRLSNSEMAQKVHKILMRRKFLIVMDDIWSTKVLDDVKHLFPDSNNGSRIMLTTRLTEVTTYNANSSTLSHEMRLMDEDKSWDLLRQKVFMNQDPIPPELEIIGREIARSCGGLPLAIVVIAGILSTVNKIPTSWEEVAKNIRSSLATADGRIEKMLSLSYTHLPHRLRPCFLYMGGFPEDHEIKAR